jgi:hypothetical protein
MMYSFKKIQAGRFVAFLSDQVRGDTHKKRFVEEGITPLRQATLNIYVSGEFDFGPENENPTRLIGGDTSLSLPDSVYPKDVIFVETVVSDTATRLCISPLVPAPWKKSVVSLVGNETFNLKESACAVLLSGKIDKQPNENGFFVGPMIITAECFSTLAIAE